MALEVVFALLEDPSLPVAPPNALDQQGRLTLHLPQVALHLGWDGIGQRQDTGAYRAPQRGDNKCPGQISLNVFEQY